ncbi:MAG: recombinase RecT [Acutalibacteraceae bacterium]
MSSKAKFSVAIATPSYQSLIKNTLGDPERSKRFVATITSAVAVNPNLQDCEAGSILAGALLGESLNLSPSPQLGQFYLVPFDVAVKDPATGKSKKDESGNIVKVKKASFVLGYKGYVQLALRSGYYKRINVLEIKEGEFISFNPFTENLICDFITNESERENAETVGYAATFEYLNGFTKLIYWSKDKMLLHADKYSPAFSAQVYEKIKAGKVPDKEMWKYSSFWYKNFDEMAKKTMIRQLISKWGVMSTELQSAFERDNSFVEVDKNKGFVGGDAVEISAPASPSVEEPAEETINLDDV